MIDAQTWLKWRDLARRDDALDHFVPSDIRQILGEIERLDAALHFFSIDECQRRVINHDPEWDRQAEMDKIEAAAIHRHRVRIA